MEFIANDTSSVTPSTSMLQQRSAQSSSEWRMRIRDIQSQKVSPELIQRLQETSSRRQRANVAVKKASILERSNKACVQSSALSFMKAEVNSATSQARGDRQQEFQRIAGSDMDRNFTLRSLASNLLRGRQIEDIDELGREMDEVEAEIQQDQQAVIATTATFRQPTASASASDGFQSMLQSLVIEPTDDDEVAAKYALFENFLNTVVVLREQTMLFWDENKDQFTGAALATCEKDIRCIDTTDSMGIFDESGGKWFVYHMMKKANDNSQAISEVLNTLKSRLQLLSATELECPFCLDTVTVDNEEALSCCHKSCKECWAHWVSIKGQGAFCPLCKHPQFVEELFSE